MSPPTPATSKQCACAAAAVPASPAALALAWRAARAPSGPDPDAVLLEAAVASIEPMIAAARSQGANRRRHVLVACFPKSASTYLNHLLLRATGFRPYLLNTAGHDTERNVALLSIPMFLARDTVSQEHMRATEENVRLLAALGVRPVVLVRDLLDVIVSARDHALAEAHRGPAAHTPRELLDWSAEEQHWFIARMGVPWFLNLFTSWVDASDALPVLWITYQDVVREPLRTLERVLDHAGVRTTAARLREAVDGADLSAVRLNRGATGRGRRELTAAQVRWVEETAAAVAGGYDLGMIGLAGKTAARHGPSQDRRIESGGRSRSERRTEGAHRALETVNGATKRRRERAVTWPPLAVPEAVDGEERARVAAWRAEGAPDAVVACCLAERRLPGIIARARERGGGRHVLLAAFPHPCADDFARRLAEAGGLRVHPLRGTGGGGRDDEDAVAPERVPGFLAGEAIAVHRGRATRRTVEHLQAMGLRPVVLVADVFETLRSLAASLAEPAWRSPIVHAPSAAAAWPEHRRLELAVRMGAPSLLSFVASWQDAARHLDVTWITADDIALDPEGAVERALTHAGAAAPMPTGDAIAHRTTPPDHAARAPAADFPPDLRCLVLEIAASYHNTHDFSPIGLPGTTERHPGSPSSPSSLRRSVAPSLP